MTGARTVHSARVEWIDTDAAGIHHHTAVVRYAEAAEARLMRELGLVDYFSSVPRVHWEIDYESPLTFGQEVTAVIEVGRLGRSSMTLNFEIWGESFNGRPRVRVARGHYVVVHVSGSYVSGDAHSAPWPSDWVAALSGETQPQTDDADPAPSGR